MSKRKSTRRRSVARMAALTVVGVLAYRIGAHIPLPGVTLDVSMDNDFLNTVSMLSGANYSAATFFSLGVMPYIMAQIVMQMLQAAFTSVKRIAKDGAAGRNKITQWTRRLTVAFAILEAVPYLFGATTTIGTVDPLVIKMMDGVILVAGAMLLMRIGEIIDERGLGRGVSVLITASILTRLPATIATQVASDGFTQHLAVAMSLFVIIVPVIVCMERATKHVAISRAALTVSSKVESYIPVRLVVAGVIPVIFASTLISLPALIAQIAGAGTDVTDAISTYTSGWYGIAIQAALIVLFAFAYASLAFDSDEVADQLDKAGAYVTEADVRPGEETARYLSHVVNQVTIPGSVLLAVVAMAPSVVAMLTGNALLTAIGGTSLIIIADTIMQMSDQARAERLVAKGVPLD